MNVTLKPYQSPEHQPFLWRGHTGCAALLIHGFPGTPAELRPLGQMVHDLGWTVQGLLLPGFGAQFDQISQYRQTDWVDSVRKALTILQKEHETVLLIGNSIGAALALQVAARQPPAALILLAPFWRSANRLFDAAFPVARLLMHQVRPFQKANFADATFRAGIERVMPDADLSDPAVQAAIRLLALPTHVLGEVRRAGRLGYAAAPTVKAPVLILQGSEDDVAHPTFTRRLACRLPTLAGYVELRGDHQLVKAQGKAWPLVSALIQQFASQIGQTQHARAHA